MFDNRNFHDIPRFVHFGMNIGHIFCNPISNSFWRMTKMSDKPRLSYIGKIRLFRRDARLYITLGAFNAFSFGISGVIFNLYMEARGFSEDFLGFFLSVSMFATAALAFFAGMIVDRTSRWKTIVLASTISFVSLFIQYSILDEISLLSSQVFIGIAGAFTQVAWSPYITDQSTDEERAHLFAFNSGVSILAVLIGNLVGGYLPGILKIIIPAYLTTAQSFQLTLLLSLIPSAFSLILVTMMSLDKPAESTHINMQLSNVTNWGFIGKYSLYVSTVGLGAGVIVLYFNLFFKNEFQASSELIGIIFAINMVILAAGNFLAPALSDRFGKVKTIIITEALSVPFLLMISYADFLVIAVIAYISRNVLMNMAWPVSNAFFMEGLKKEERATAMGVTRAGDSLVRGIAANIGGALLAAGYYREPYLLVSGLYIIAVIMLYLFFRNKEKEIESRKDIELVRAKKPKESADIT